METLDETYQVFISFKNADAPVDVDVAERLFHALRARGVKTFFSNVSVQESGSSFYSDTIDSALDSAQVMVVVGTSMENITSEWVKYEWSSFDGDIRDGRKTNAMLVTYTDNIDLQLLPRALRLHDHYLFARNGVDEIVNRIVTYLSSTGWTPPSTDEVDGEGAKTDGTARHGEAAPGKNREQQPVSEGGETNSVEPAPKQKRHLSKRVVAILAVAIACACLAIGVSVKSAQDAEEAQEAQAAQEMQDAEDAVSITLDTTNFDGELCNELKYNHDTDGNGLLSPDECSQVTSLTLYNTNCRGITNLTSLTSLTVAASGSVDLSTCNTLQYLTIYPYDGATVKTLSLPASAALKELHLSHLNTSESFGFSDTWKDSLEVVSFDDVSLSSADVSSLKNLESLDLSGSPVTAVSAIGCSKLKSINVTGCTDLVSIYLSGTPEDVVVTGATDAVTIKR